MSTIPATTPTPGEADRRARLTDLLDAFDPNRHGGEAMAFAPVGKEFGSPTYDESDVGDGDAKA